MRPRIYVDFNEMVEKDLVLLSRGDIRQDSEGNQITLSEGLRISVYMDDADDSGNPRNLVAEGTVEINTSDDWSSPVNWCCRLDEDSFRYEVVPKP